jgi:hypothetical protein
MALHLNNIVKGRMGVSALTNIHTHFEDHDDCRVMIVRCEVSNVPVYVTDGQTERFYVRTGPSTTELSISEAQQYIAQRFSK